MTMIGIAISPCSDLGGSGDGSNPDLNSPTLELQDGGTPTHTADEGDDLVAAVTVDDGDGATTSDVELYANGVFIDSMDDDGGGDWSLAINDVTEGTFVYRAKRITDLGFRWSATWQVVVSAVAGDFLTDGGDTLTTGGDSLLNG